MARKENLQSVITQNMREQDIFALRMAGATEYFEKMMDFLSDYYSKEKTAQEKFNAKRIRDAKAMADEINQYEMYGYKTTQEFRDKLAKKYADKEKKEKLEQLDKDINEETKKRLKAYKKEQREKLKNDIEFNKEKIKILKEREKELTQEQKEELKELQSLVTLGEKAKRQDAWTKTRNEAIENAIKNSVNAALNAVSNTINSYAKLQEGVNARLQGANVERTFGNMWSGAFGSMEDRISFALGVNPYVKTENVLTKLSELVNTGIAYNVEQRAFLGTIKDSIASTFDAANGTLLKLVRVQQRDSTAQRLGMEAYLTRFLNNMVSNTEYLSTTFDNVSEALYEASSQMSVGGSAELEYVVQKWLGSLVGVGFGESSAQGIAQALGYLGSGNIEALSGSGFADLLVMAASRSNLSYSDILTKGLSAQTANTLMDSLVKYLINIGSSSNNVVRSQYANLFGLNISDLTAASNLRSSLDDIYNANISYLGMFSELEHQMNILGTRVSTASMIQNVMSNAQWALGTGIAKNPILASLWGITSMIQDATGGINIPETFVLGSGIELNATVEQLMKLGLVGISSLGMIGDIVSGIGSTVNPSSILSKLGIKSDANVVSRGSGLTTQLSGLGTSLSGTRYEGGGSGEDIKEQTLQTARESAVESGVENSTAKEMETVVREVVPDIRDILQNMSSDYLSSITETTRTISSTLEDIKDKISKMTYGGY